MKKPLKMYEIGAAVLFVLMALAPMCFADDPPSHGNGAVTGVVTDVQKNPDNSIDVTIKQDPNHDGVYDYPVTMHFVSPEDPNKEAEYEGFYLQLKAAADKNKVDPDTVLTTITYTWEQQPGEPINRTITSVTNRTLPRRIGTNQQPQPIGDIEIEPTI